VSTISENEYNKSNEGGNDMDSKEIRELQRMMEALKHRPEEEVVDEFANLIKSGKLGISITQAGSMVQMLMPMLSSEQKKTLHKLINRINS